MAFAALQVVFQDLGYHYATLVTALHFVGGYVHSEATDSMS